MRYLKEYKIFENLQDNEDYITLAHLLYDLFDKWGIVEWTDESFEHLDAPFNEGYPVHKFWSFRKTNYSNLKQSELDKEVVKESLGREISVRAEVYGDSPVGDLMDYTIKIK